VALASYHLLDIEDWLSGSMKSLGYGTQERVSWDVQSTSRKEYAYSCSEDMKLLEDSSICCNWSWHPIACWDAPYKLTMFKSLFQKTQTQWGLHDPINTWNQQNVVVWVFTLLVFGCHLDSGNYLVSWVLIDCVLNIECFARSTPQCRMHAITIT
jgi:hypothetical protein